jgi:hypothetical protein
VNYVPSVEDLVYMGLTIGAVIAFYAVIVAIITYMAPAEIHRLVRKMLRLSSPTVFA